MSAQKTRNGRRHDFRHTALGGIKNPAQRPDIIRGALSSDRLIPSESGCRRWGQF